MLNRASSINGGSYSPLSRPLFVYVNNFSLQREDVRAFIEYYLNNAGALANEVGFVGLPDVDYQSQFSKLN